MKRVLYLCVCLICATTVFAQELKVKRMVVCENDSSAITMPKKDGNNELCALIKVQFAASEAKFDGDIVGKVESTLKEYRVYMPDDSRFLTIHQQEYLPLEVSFDDYIKGGVKSGNTYTLIVDIPDITINNYSSKELYELGKEYYEGKNGKSIDLIQAEYLLHRAAEKGMTEAQALLGFVYLSREDLNKRVESKNWNTSDIKTRESDTKLKETWVLADYWFSKAAEKGNPKAMTGLGRCEINKASLAYNKYKPNHRKKALEWLLKAAEKKEESSYWWLGFFYYKGYQSKDVLERPDYKESFKWYLKSAEAGDIEGMRSVAFYYDQGIGVEEDSLQAFKWYHKAADQGDLESQYKVATFYDLGEYVRLNHNIAFHYYEMAAKRGHVLSQVALSYCYSNGEGVKEDSTEAVFWARKAAEKGSAKGQFLLGLYYEHGYGVDKDIKRAKHWYDLSVKQDYPEAYVYLGYWYATGENVKKDEKKARAYFYSAAIRGNAQGQCAYGLCAKDGIGMEVNLSIAKKYLQKAADQGDEDAQEALLEIEQEENNK